MCSGFEAGSYLRLIDSCITQLKAQGLSRTCNESNEEEEERRGVAHLLALARALGREAVLEQPLPQLVVDLRQMVRLFRTHAPNGVVGQMRQMVWLFRTPAPDGALVQNTYFRALPRFGLDTTLKDLLSSSKL